MEINSIDKSISEKLKERKLNPSPSAWERLSDQLDNQQEKKQHIKRLNIVGYAASVVILVASFLYFKKDGEKIVPKKEIFVLQPIDTSLIDRQFKKEVIEVEKAIVVKEINNSFIKKELKPSVKKKENKIKASVKIKNQEGIAIVNREHKEVENVVMILKDTNKIQKRITINPNDLLYAVTHSPEEVKEYYAKYNINRNEVLDTIHKKLIKSNLKIDATTILAEIERDINEEDFQDNFMQKFKSKLSNVIVAIADRNK